MTDEQIEVAARKLCEIREWKPEEKQGIFGTRLEIAKSEVLKFYQVAQAIDHALGGEQFP
jgi:hypothetical protein